MKPTPKQVRSVRFDAPTLKRMSDFCEKRKLTFTELVYTAITVYLGRENQ